MMSYLHLQKLVRDEGFYPGNRMDMRIKHRRENESTYKTLFRAMGKLFLEQLARKELKLDEFQVKYNQAGIAVSGDHTLMGFRGGKGIYLTFNADNSMGEEHFFLYRTISGMKDYQGGPNHYMSLLTPYETFLATLEKLLA